MRCQQCTHRFGLRVGNHARLDEPIEQRQGGPRPACQAQRVGSIGRRIVDLGRLRIVAEEEFGLLPFGRRLFDRRDARARRLLADLRNDHGLHRIAGTHGALIPLGRALRELLRRRRLDVLPLQHEELLGHPLALAAQEHIQRCAVLLRPLRERSKHTLPQGLINARRAQQPNRQLLHAEAPVDRYAKRCTHAPSPGHALQRRQLRRQRRIQRHIVVDDRGGRRGHGLPACVVDRGHTAEHRLLFLLKLIHGACWINRLGWRRRITGAAAVSMRRRIVRHRVRRAGLLLRLAHHAIDPFHEAPVLSPDRLLLSGTPAAALQRLADRAHQATQQVAAGPSMAIDLGLEPGPSLRIVPQHALERPGSIERGELAQPTTRASNHRKLPTHPHALDALRGIHRHQGRDGGEEGTIQLLLCQLQLDRWSPLALHVAFGCLDGLARSLDKRRMARDVVHMHSLERLPVGRLCAGLLAEHARKRTDVDGLDREIRVLRGRRRRQDQRRHPRQKREPRGARLHIALPSPITRRHALIWPRCIIW